MSPLDALLLVVLVAFAARGWWRGLLREVFGLAGLVGGALAAAWGRAPLGDALVARRLLSPAASRAVAVAALFLVVWVVAQVTGLVAERAARALFLGGLNRTAGIAFGLAKGAVAAGVGLLLLQRVAPSPGLGRLVDGSTLGRPLVAFASGLVQAGEDLAAGRRG